MPVSKISCARRLTMFWIGAINWMVRTHALQYCTLYTVHIHSKLYTVLYVHRNTGSTCYMLRVTFHRISWAVFCVCLSIQLNHGTCSWRLVSPFTLGSIYPACMSSRRCVRDVKEPGIRVKEIQMGGKEAINDGTYVCTSLYVCMYVTSCAPPKSIRVVVGCHYFFCCRNS